MKIAHREKKNFRARTIISFSETNINCWFCFEYEHCQRIYIYIYTKKETKKSNAKQKNKEEKKTICDTSDSIAIGYICILNVFYLSVETAICEQN